MENTVTFFLSDNGRQRTGFQFSTEHDPEDRYG